MSVVINPFIVSGKIPEAFLEYDSDILNITIF